MSPFEDEVQVATSADPLEVDRWIVVLEAVGLSHRVVPVDAGWLLRVPAPLEEQVRTLLEEDAQDAARAEARERENVRAGRSLALEWAHFSWSPQSAALLAVVLSAAFLAPSAVVSRAALNGEAVRAGEVWRLLTALTLHADVAHLVGNLAVGGVIVAAVCGFLGPGAGFFAVLSAGAMGNLLSVLVHEPGYVSLGASTAVFGGIGVLGGVLAARRNGLGVSLVAAPLGVGFMLLIQFGLGTGNTDVVAHVTGFLAGVLGGVALGQRRLYGPRAQWALGALATALLGAAWVQVLS